jgi:alkaline phosphatase
MKVLKRSISMCLVLSAALIIAAGSVWAGTPMYEGKSAKYVFLFIGDGMGIPQRTATEKFAGVKLGMDAFPAQGITSTHANDRFITGSAASATALGAGQKTNIGVIGMNPDMKSVKSLAEIAKENGMKAGVISSVSIDHATPAAFYAHVPKRSMYHEIDHMLAESDIDFFGGGGLKDPAGKKSKKPKGDAIEAAEKNGFKIVTDKKEFLKLNKGDGRVLAWNKNLPDGKALPYVLDQDPTEDISLVEFTSKAVELLDNDKGFFLMVEGGKIDWACHANDATSALTNTIEFDKAVRQAVDFYEKHPEETLVVVTGDHECGGLTLGFAGTKYQSHFDLLASQNISFQKFADEVMAGLKASKASFDDAKPLITKHFGLKFEGGPHDKLVLGEHEVKQITEAYQRSMEGEKVKSGDPTTYIMYGGYDPLTVTLTHILNQKAGLSWTSYKHTGVPVSTSAMGVGAEIFNGFYDNTDVALKIMSVMGFKPKVYMAGEALEKAGRRLVAN